MLRLIPLEYYILSGGVNFLTAIIMALLVFLSGKKARSSRIFAAFSLSVAYWSLLYFAWLVSGDKHWAEFYLRSCMIGVLFMPSLFIHFVLSFLKHKINKKFIIINYSLSILFSLSVYTPLYASDIGRHLVFAYWLRAGPIFPLTLIHFGAVVLYAFYLMWQSLRKEEGYFRNQILYVFIGTAIGYIAGVTNFLGWYRVAIPPFLNIFVSFYVVMVAIAILKHRLMDINIALTRAGIFLFVYSFVLGVPFWVGYTTKSWFPATALAVVLASLGPFIYQRLRKQAEDIILKDQKAYQKALLETSSKMLLIKELFRLLETAGSTIMETVKVSFAGIYVEDEKTKKYTCRYKQAREGECGLPEELAEESELARHLSANKLPLIGEEADGSKCKIGLAAPFMVNDVLLGFMLLGEKDHNRAYTQDDVNVFTILANQIAMAIENCQFYGREKENQAMIYQSATLADMGVMADSMGHQIKNHIQKMTAQAGSQAGIIEEFLNQGIDKEKAEQLLRRLISVLCKIESQGEAGGRLIESISRFSRLPLESYREITLKEIIESANDILRFKVKFEDIDYQVNLPDTLPVLYAHPVFAEAFVNLIDNANDAIKERSDKLEFRAKNNGEPPAPYRGSITISAAERDSQIEIEVEDNGIGIKKENARNLFLPFYTTKATANKGTGLGLFVIKRIVSDHGGRISIDSDYMRGTKFTITLPIRQKGKET